MPLQTPLSHQSSTDIRMGPQPRKRRRELLIFVFPNLFTTANLFCGFFSIIQAIQGDWVASAVAILIAAFTDGLDGRIARLTKTQSAFGEQYDSMSDLVSFGAAPAVLMFQWALAPYGRLGWLVAFVYLACAALRLARFNVLKQHTEKRYFSGCPSPLAACSVAAAVLFYQEMGFAGWKSVYMLFVTAALGSAMVSRIRYRSFKDFKFASQTHFAYLLIIIAGLVLVVASPERILFPVFAFYIVAGPVAELSRFLRRRFKWYPGKGRS